MSHAVIEIDELVCPGFGKANGSFSIALSPGTTAVTATHPSFAPQTAYSIDVLVGTTTVLDF